MNKAYVSSLEDIHYWYSSKGHAASQWALFRGHHDNVPTRGIIHRQNDPALPVSDSWEILAEMIERNSSNGGDFTIHIPMMNSGKGESLTIRMPGQSSGISGVGGFSELLELHLSNYDLRRKLEDMESAQLGRPTVADRLWEKLEGVDISPLVNALGGIIANAVAGSGAGVHTQPMNINGQHGNPGAVPMPQTQDDERELVEAIGITMLPIAAHFDDPHEMIRLLGKLVDKFSQNPDMYKSLLNQ